MNRHQGSAADAYPHHMRQQVLQERDRNRNMSSPIWKPKSEAGKKFLEIADLSSSSRKRTRSSDGYASDEDDYATPPKSRRISPSSSTSPDTPASPSARRIKRAPTKPTIHTSRGRVSYTSARVPDVVLHITPPPTPTPPTSTPPTPTLRLLTRSSSTSPKATLVLSTASPTTNTPNTTPPSAAESTSVLQPPALASPPASSTNQSPACFQCNFAKNLAAKATENAEHLKAHLEQVKEVHNEALEAKDDEYYVATSVLDNDLEVSQKNRAEDKKRFESDIVKKDEKISQLNFEIREKHDKIMEYERTISSRDKRILELEQQLKQKSELVEHRPPPSDEDSNSNGWDRIMEVRAQANDYQKKAKQHADTIAVKNAEISQLTKRKDAAEAEVARVQKQLAKKPAQVPTFNPGGSSTGSVASSGIDISMPALATSPSRNYDDEMELDQRDEENELPAITDKISESGNAMETDDLQDEDGIKSAPSGPDVPEKGHSASPFAPLPPNVYEGSTTSNLDTAMTNSTFNKPIPPSHAPTEPRANREKREREARENARCQKAFSNNGAESLVESSSSDVQHINIGNATSIDASISGSNHAAASPFSNHGVPGQHRNGPTTRSDSLSGRDERSSTSSMGDAAVDEILAEPSPLGHEWTKYWHNALIQGDAYM